MICVTKHFFFKFLICFVLEQQTLLLYEILANETNKFITEKILIQVFPTEIDTIHQIYIKLQNKINHQRGVASKI